MKKSSIKALFTSVGVALLLSSCGKSSSHGNSFNPKNSNPNVALTANNFESKVDKKVLQITKKAQASMVNIQQNDSGLNFTLPTDSQSFANVKNKQVVQIQPSDEFPFGFAGVVTEKSQTGQVKLRPAMVEEVFESVNFDFDSRRDGAKVLGVIKTNDNINLNIQQKPHQLGITKFENINKKNCAGSAAIYDIASYLANVTGKGKNNLGALEKQEENNNQFTFNFNNVNANINFSSNCHLLSGTKNFGADYKASFTITKKDSIGVFFGEVNLTDLVMVQKAIYDEKNKGWEALESYQSGKISTKIGFKTSKSNKNLSVTMPSVAELLLNTNDPEQKTKWDKLTLGNGFANIKGLDGSDKKGLFPLGGIVFGPASQPFIGEISEASLVANKVGAVILWLYLRADGEVVISGEISEEVEEMTFKRGASYHSDGQGGLTGEVFNQPINPIFKFNVGGKAELTHQLGVTPALDLLIGGVRPLTVQMDLVKYKLNTKVGGDFSWITNKEVPKGRSRFEGFNGCVSSSIDILSELTVKARVEANLNVFGMKKTAGIGWLYNQPHTLMEGLKFKKCMKGEDLPVQITEKQLSLVNNNVAFNVDYKDAYNTAKDNQLIDSWLIKAKNLTDNTVVYYDLFTNNLTNGYFELPKEHRYKVQLVAFSNLHGEVLTSKVKNFDLRIDNASIKINSLTINPEKPIVGSKYQVILDGLNMPTVNPLVITGCENKVVIDKSLTKQTYQCTASINPLSKLITIKTPDGKSKLFEQSFQIINYGLNYNLPTTATVGKPYNYSITQAKDDKTCYTSFNIDFGDGEKRKGNAKCIIVANLPKHTYTKAGTYTAKFTLTDSTNKTQAKTQKVTVKPAPKATSKLTATGITKCGDYAYDANGNLISGHTHSNKEDCSKTVDSEGDPIPAGQDGHVQAGEKMSYTKLTRNGAECVKDNITGLIWEQKTDDGGLRDKDNTYTWYNPDNKTNGSDTGTNNGAGKQNGGTCQGSACDTHAYIQALNNANYCGYSDWRLPTRTELVSIVDYGRTNPTINPVFTNTQSNWYWSSSPAASTSNFAWIVLFDFGHANSNNKDDTYHVRAVRSGS